MFCLLRNPSVSQPRSGSRATRPSLGTLQVSSYQGVESKGELHTATKMRLRRKMWGRGQKNGRVAFLNEPHLSGWKHWFKLKLLTCRGKSQREKKNCHGAHEQGPFPQLLLQSCMQSAAERENACSTALQRMNTGEEGEKQELTSTPNYHTAVECSTLHIEHSKGYSRRKCVVNY